MKIRKLYIDNLKIFQDFNLDFTYNGKAQNLVVIAGLNGSGKTTLFRDFIFHTFKNKDISDDSFIEIEQKEDNDKKIYTINNERLKSDFSDVMKYRSDVALPEYENIIFHEAGISNKKTAKDTILQFIDDLIYEQDKKGSEAYSITQEILNSVFQDFELKIEFKGIDRNKEVLFGNNSPAKIKIEDLSGGEQELITKVFTLHLSDIKDSIILIDEPESSLHPNWQNRITQIYQGFADKNDNQIILATHSPHIVASVRKEQIRVLAQEEESGLI
ncbi:AAA family ATPase [Desulfobacterales bacterium HSG16]|nr:AAA family ATPase [Desulfobacterales bacterium HSG16]